MTVSIKVSLESLTPILNIGDQVDDFLLGVEVPNYYKIHIPYFFIDDTFTLEVFGDHIDRTSFQLTYKDGDISEYNYDEVGSLNGDSLKLEVGSLSYGAGITT